MARIIFEYDKFDSWGDPIEGRYTRQLDLSAISEELESSPHTLVNALIAIQTLDAESLQAHADSCSQFRTEDPDRYQRILDMSMKVSIFNETKRKSEPKIPLRSAKEVARALRSLKRQKSK